MKPLRQSMIALMERENFAPLTIESYVRAMALFAKHYGKCPSELGDDEIAAYLHYRRKVEKRSCSSIQISFTALKLSYTRVLDRPWNHHMLRRPKEPKKLPEILSEAEIGPAVAKLSPTATGSHNKLVDSDKN